MRIAVIGAGGQLGSDLLDVLRDEAIPLNHQQIEITNAENVESVLRAAAPDAVINAAAYNLVDRAEDEPDLAHAVNALGPKHIATACAKLNVKFLHVSTDYVFGAGHARTTPYTETDPNSPSSVYASSKLAGEEFARDFCRNSFVVRTCGLYGRAGGNFVETMLRLAGEHDELRVVNDQRCTPTSTAELAAALVNLVQTDAYGLYHATNSGETTWYEFAREIFRLAQIDVRVVPITSAEFGAKAARPPYSVLDCTKLTNTLGEPLRPWQDALAEYLHTRAEN